MNDASHLVELKCDECKKVFKRSSMHVNKNKNKFCDKTCKHIYYQKHFDIKRYPSRYGDSWWYKRLNALERDKKCLICNSQENLQVHHFIKLKFFHNSEDAHFINNLGTFCRSCHYKVEKMNYNSYDHFINNYNKDIV